jgi:hypothetical protein
MLDESEGETQHSNSTNFLVQHAARQIWPDHDMNMMINDNNYFTQLTTLDMMRRIRASDLWIALDFFICLLLFSVQLTHTFLHLGAQFPWQILLLVLHLGICDVETLYKVVTIYDIELYISRKDNTALQLVSKLLVLAIRDIRKLDVSSVAQRTLSNQLVATLVFPHIVHPQRQRQNHCNGASDDDRDLGWNVIRRTLLSEGKRAHDVAQTKRDQQHGVHGCL